MTDEQAVAPYKRVWADDDQAGAKEDEVEQITRIIRREVFGSPEYTDCLPELAAGYERAARTILAALGYEDSVEHKAMLIRWCDDTSEAAREVYRNSARALVSVKP